MPKGNGNSRPAGPKVRYADAGRVAHALSEMAGTLPLAMNVAMRGALIRNEAQLASEAYQNEARKRSKTLACERKDLSPQDERAHEEAMIAADLDIATEGRKTFIISAGWIDYSEIETAVESWQKLQEGEKKHTRPEGLGNILAGLVPVLKGAPED